MRVYLVGGDRLTVPEAALIREDPINGSMICTDYYGCPIMTLTKAQLIGYLMLRCQSESEECFRP